MKTYYFSKTVQADGSISISNLPPNTHVEIVVMKLEPSDTQTDLRHWLDDIRTRHPFAQKSKAEILRELRQTREIVWTERHAH